MQGRFPRGFSIEENFRRDRENLSIEIFIGQRPFYVFCILKEEKKHSLGVMCHFTMRCKFQFIKTIEIFKIVYK